MKIEVCGPGCPRCKETIRRVEETLKELGTEADVKHVHDISKMTEYGVVMTPAIVIDGEIQVMGRIPEKSEIMGYINKAREK